MNDSFVYVPPAEPETPAEFAEEIVRDAVEVMREPRIALPALGISLIADAVLAGLEWPFRNPTHSPVESTVTTMACLMLAKAWLELTVMHMGLAYLRREPVGFWRQWVPVQSALRILVVSMVLLAPIALGTLLLVLPGLYFLAKWSQATMAMIDGTAHWFDAADYSASLTAGYKLPIALLWTAIFLTGALLAWTVTTALSWTGLVGLRPVMDALLRAGAYLIGASLMVSLYFNLEDRAPWNVKAAPPTRL